MFILPWIVYIGRGARARLAEEARMRAKTLRHKHLQLDQAKLDRARKVLGAATETQTLDRALDVVLSEAAIDTVLRRAGGKGTLRRMFR
jgi:hypothetical protein